MPGWDCDPEAPWKISACDCKATGWRPGTIPWKRISATAPCRCTGSTRARAGSAGICRWCARKAASGLIPPAWRCRSRGYSASRWRRAASAAISAGKDTPVTGWSTAARCASAATMVAAVAVSACICRTTRPYPRGLNCAWISRTATARAPRITTRPRTSSRPRSPGWSAPSLMARSPKAISCTTARYANFRSVTAAASSSCAGTCAAAFTAF